MTDTIENLRLRLAESEEHLRVLRGFADVAEIQFAQTGLYDLIDGWQKPIAGEAPARHRDELRCSPQMTAGAIYAAADAMRALRNHLELGPGASSSAAPVDMLLFCPACSTQHVDAADPEGVTSVEINGREDRWDNPPHRTHLCHACGHRWRPADVATNGVLAIATKGQLDGAAAPAYFAAVAKTEGVALGLARASANIRQSAIAIRSVAARLTPGSNRTNLEINATSLDNLAARIRDLPAVSTRSMGE